MAPTVSDAAIWDVWLCAFHAPALAICDELGMFAALHERPATTTDLASVLGIELRAAEALAGLMSSLGFLGQADGMFHLTDIARYYLVPHSPFYWGGFLRRIRDNPIDCKRLLESLRRRDGRVTREMWRAPKPPPEALEAFTHAMHAHSYALATRAVPALELGATRRLLDVGGGSGSFSIAAAQHHEQLCCVVLDLAPVCAVARRYAEMAGVADRVETAAADMFVDRWPTGFDGVFFSDVFHDWDDEQCAHLVARAREALEPGGRVIVHEMLVSETKDSPLAAVSYSVIMLFATEGRQRSARELVQMLDTAGFTNVEVRLTSGGYASISGTRPT